jgi:hypothetical protein
MDRLRRLRDPRQPRGRRYRLPGLIAMLVLGAMQGEYSLTRMWRWASDHWQDLVGPLDLWGTPKPASYDAIMHLVHALDPDQLAACLGVPSPSSDESGALAVGISKVHAERIRVVFCSAGLLYGHTLRSRPLAYVDPLEALVGFICEVPLSEISPIPSLSRPLPTLTPTLDRADSRSNAATALPDILAKAVAAVPQP